MLASDKYYAVNIREYLALGDDPEAGEPALAKLLSGFSCSKNPDVERFLKKKCHRVYKKEPVCYICSGFGKRWRSAWIFYPCIKAFDGQGRNSKQYYEKKAAACQ